MSEIIINDIFIHIFMLAFACTVLMAFISSHIGYLTQKKQINELFRKLETQRILVTHLEKTVTWFSKPENTISKCPEGATCETAQNICIMAKAALERIEANV